MSEWYENWFDSEYYHILYNNRNQKEAELFIDKLLMFLKPKKNSYFLDLCCGTGRHSIYLNKKGFHVDGIDLSSYSLSIAKKKQNLKLNFFNRDMRNINEIKKYNFVINLFTSFGYFESKDDNEIVINGISTALKRNGVFVMDFINMSKCLDSIVKKEIKKIKNYSFTINKWYDKKYLYKKIEFLGKEYFERIQILKKEEIINMCENQNLKLINSFGDYQLNKFDEKSERLILIFKKN